MAGDSRPRRGRLAAIVVAVFLALCLIAGVVTLLTANAIATGWGEGASAYSTVGNVGQVALAMVGIGCACAAGVRLLERRSMALSFLLLCLSAITLAAWWVMVVWLVG